MPAVLLNTIFGLDPRLLGALLLLLILGPTVYFAQRRSQARIQGARGVYQAFAEQVGLDWSPPSNQGDSLGPGQVRGRYRERKVRVDVSTPTGAARNRLPEALVQVHFRRSLGLGLQGGHGTFRARTPGNPGLADQKLSDLLRARAQDEAGARALLDDPQVAAGLRALAPTVRGLGIDDGTLRCAVPLPLSVEDLLRPLDALLGVVETIDSARERTRGA